MDIPDWAYGVPSVSVIGERFCFPYPMELTVNKKVKKLSDAHFDVTDSYGNVLIQVQGGVWNFTVKRILRDPAGFPLLTLRGKALSLWHKWKAYDGESCGENSMLFTVRQSHPVQFKKVLNVFLGNNEKVPDFQVSGSYTSLSFKVFQDRRLLAEVKHNFTWESFCKGKESYRIKVYPEVDYAFIVALLVILDENDTP
ncbi:hypothetical protein K2173_002969 [Erythroxylum novogranatense]|uniref:Protein LURP-one-related 14 n=1 Tax=Erythroxylum novogranatense TaxID=1862640 RepID=A0AAV8TTR7_9ROSI|nr:hypothetical protein K2173_002969 [Erythroxylum novogranatense]